MKHDVQLFKRYCTASAVSAAADTAMFVALLLLLKKRSIRAYLLISVICPRLISAVINYNMHKRFTFRYSSKRTLRRYCLLALAVLAASYGNACLWDHLAEPYIILLKPAGDAVIGLITPVINRRWVFGEPESGRFYGSYSRAVKWLSKHILKRYDVTGIEERHTGQPVVYVCRHGNMHGPVNTLSNFKSDIHPMVLDCFFSIKDCRRHFYEYTFSSRFGIPKPLARCMAGISALITVPIMHSLQAIPVHRDSNAMSTLRTAVKYLEKGESVIVFPDVSYTDSDGDGEIYRGFVTMGHIYHRSTGKPLNFVPLVIDDVNARIVALDSYEWRKGSDRDEAAAYLRHAIHTDVSEYTLPPSENCGDHSELTSELERYA